MFTRCLLTIASKTLLSGCIMCVVAMFSYHVTNSRGSNFQSLKCDHLTAGIRDPGVLPDNCKPKHKELNPDLTRKSVYIKLQLEHEFYLFINVQNARRESLLSTS